MAISILIADDHGLIRAGLRALLQEVSELTVVGEAENGYTALQPHRRVEAGYRADGYQPARVERHRGHPPGAGYFPGDAGVDADGA